VRFVTDAFDEEFPAVNKKPAVVDP